MKRRAMRLDHGNFSWGSENRALKSRIIDVVYNATSNEMVRTKTLVKNCIVQVDASPFKQYYLTQYGIVVGKEVEEVKVSETTKAKRQARAKKASIGDKLALQFKSG